MWATTWTAQRTATSRGWHAIPRQLRRQPLEPAGGTGDAAPAVPRSGDLTCPTCGVRVPIAKQLLSGTPAAGATLWVRCRRDHRFDALDPRGD